MRVGVGAASGFLVASLCLGFALIAGLLLLNGRDLPRDVFDSDVDRVALLRDFLQTEPAFSSRNWSVNEPAPNGGVRFVLVSGQTSSRSIPNDLKSGLNAAYDSRFDSILVSPAMIDVLAVVKTGWGNANLITLLFLHELGHREDFLRGTPARDVRAAEQRADLFAIREYVEARDVSLSELVEELWNIAEGGILTQFTGSGSFDPVTDYATHGSFFARVSTIYATLLEVDDLLEEDRRFVEALLEQSLRFMESSRRFVSLFSAEGAHIPVFAARCGRDLRLIDETAGIYAMAIADALATGVTEVKRLRRLQALDSAGQASFEVRSAACDKDGRLVIETTDGALLREGEPAGAGVIFEALVGSDEMSQALSALAERINVGATAEGENVRVSIQAPDGTEKVRSLFQPIGLYAALGSFTRIEAVDLRVAVDDESSCAAIDLPGRFFALIDGTGNQLLVDSYLAGSGLALSLGDGAFLTGIPFSRFVVILRCSDTRPAT